MPEWPLMGATSGAPPCCFRLPEVTHHLGVLLVLSVLIVGPASSAKDLRQSQGLSASIGADGDLRAEKGHKKSRSMALMRGGHRERFTTPDPDSYESSQNHTALDPTADLDPMVYMMFPKDAGGAWNGNRNDLDGEYGFAFTPRRHLIVTALGRQSTGRWDHGYKLFQKANVTIWATPVVGREVDYVTPEDYLKLKVVSLSIGPDDEACCEQKYQFKYLEKPVQLYADVEYRLTQTVWQNMEDLWFDSVAYDTDIAFYSLVECISLGNGVHSERKHHYPQNVDKMHRRVGMLNIRVESNDACGVAIPEEGDVSFR